MTSDFRIVDQARHNRRIRNDYQGKMQVQGSGYADDIVLFFESTNDLQKALVTINTTFDRFGLRVNTQKTDTMIFNFNSNEKINPTSICSLNGHKKTTQKPCNISVAKLTTINQDSENLR